VGNTLNLQLPLLLADIGVNDGVLLHLSLHLTSKISLNVTATKV
jgi:hypothetical protein